MGDKALKSARRPPRHGAFRVPASYTRPMAHSVLIVEDDARLRDVFVHAVGSADDLQVVGAAADVAEGIRLLDSLRPDVLLVDLALPDGHGITLIRHVAKVQPPCLPVVITIFDDNAGVIDCIRAGAVGYLLKDTRDLDIVKEIRGLCEGGSPISAAIARRLLRWVNDLPQPVDASAGTPNSPVVDSVAGSLGGFQGLSPQETAVLRLCAKGYKYEEIAHLLTVNRCTVATYIKRIYQKLQVHSKTEAVYEARKLGLLDD